MLAISHNSNTSKTTKITTSLFSLHVHHHGGRILKIRLPQVGEACHGGTIDDPVIGWPAHLHDVCPPHIARATEPWQHLKQEQPHHLQMTDRERSRETEKEVERERKRQAGRRIKRDRKIGRKADRQNDRKRKHISSVKMTCTTLTWILPRAPMATSGGRITGLAYVPPICQQVFTHQYFFQQYSGLILYTMTTTHFLTRKSVFPSCITLCCVWQHLSAKSSKHHYSLSQYLRGWRCCQ